MKINEIITYSDFKNLTKEDIDNIVSKLGIDISDKKDIRYYLYSIKNMIFENSELNTLVLERVFAGRTSLKWYRLNLPEEKIPELINKIESDENFFNCKADIASDSVTDITQYTCIKLEENKYIIRLYVPTGTKTVDNGVSLSKIKTISNTTAILDVKNNLLEVRSNSKFSDKIARLIMNNLKLTYNGGRLVLGKYRNSIELLRDALNNGKFIDTTSIPDENIELSFEENKLVVETLEALDRYFYDNNESELINKLSKMKTDGIPFTQLLLSGMSKIGMAVQQNDNDDLSKKSLYNLFKSYMTDYSGYITFTLPGDDLNRYTIQVGVTTNTISFRSSATEEVIDYIKSKIV
ncbi:MAG: hypothetical protein E7J31_09585 [Clostridium sp.]|uniref:hypothetical protein n=1 Tax=Clostridium sp. TaxID=1506 RepID=UPI00290C3EDF|nr:hypothetical protein [Clostridium sp.]MDU7948679.1 hypothetical protein [Clostridium sp.]